MRGKTQAHSFYFLAELLFVILCFAVSSVLCVRLFVAANQKHTQSVQLKQALMKIQPYAEQLRYYDATIPLADYLALADCQQDQCIVYFDKDWQESTQPAWYEMTVSSQQVGSNRENKIQIVEKIKNRMIVELQPVSWKGNANEE